jgi:hypothetical protein
MRDSGVLQLFTELIVAPSNAICIKCYDALERHMNSCNHFVSLS